MSASIRNDPENPVYLQLGVLPGGQLQLGLKNNRTQDVVTIILTREKMTALRAAIDRALAVGRQ